MPSPFPGMNPYLEAWSIRQALSKIMIPLAAPDPDIALDLGELFTTTYDRGRYKRSLDYSAPPAAPLAVDDLQWAAAIGQCVVSRT